MAFLKQIKKGGSGRTTLVKSAINDYFVIPKGFKIDYLWATTENGALTGAVNMGVGSTPAVQAVTTLAITGTATAAVATTFTVDGVAWTVTAPSIGATAAQIAALFMANPPEGVTVTSPTAGTLVLTFQSAGDKTVTLSTANGYSCTPAKTVTGTTSADIVTAAAVTTTSNAVTKYTPASGKEFVLPNASADGKFYVHFTNGYGVNKVNVYVGYSKFN